jgi:hypothetical protein
VKEGRKEVMEGSDGRKEVMEGRKEGSGGREEGRKEVMEGDEGRKEVKEGRGGRTWWKEVKEVMEGRK